MNNTFRDELHKSSAQKVTMNLLESSSEDEETVKKWGGSEPGRAPNGERYRERGAQRLYLDYFAVSSVYSEEQFRRRFRVSRSIFDTVLQGVCEADMFFVQKQDAARRWGLTSLQKVTCAFRMLAYGAAADASDEYLHLGESTAHQCLKRFSCAVVRAFGSKYLRYPRPFDLKRILSESERRGFPGLLGSIDCCKWKWKNYSTALHGQYQGKEKVPALTLEAIADYDLWFWHAFFGMPGSLNDINVLEASPLPNEIASGRYSLPLEYTLGGCRRNILYWFADGIYPEQPMFVHAVSEPSNQKEKLLARYQEGERKDVERAFGVLQVNWHLIARPSHFWYKDTMHDIMRCCIILHNRMVERRIVHEHKNNDAAMQTVATVDDNLPPMWSNVNSSANVCPPSGSIAALCAVQKLTKSKDEYYRTRQLFMKHIWDTFGKRLQ